MYLKSNGGYYVGTEQHARRAPYLILFSTFQARYPNGKPRLYAAVRQVALHQCGHWMMGSATIHGHRIPISGSCGSDGLPRDYDPLPEVVKDALVSVPEDVAAVYWADDGHNTIGSSRQTLADWAETTFKF